MHINTHTVKKSVKRNRGEKEEEEESQRKGENGEGKKQKMEMCCIYLPYDTMVYLF